MFKFITPQNKEITFNQDVVEVEEDFSPIKEIMKKGDFSGFSFVTSEEETISLGNVFNLHVNIKNIGLFHFIFRNGGFIKEDLIKQVNGLKEINVDNEESAKYKVSALITAVKGYDPIFAIFKECPETYYYSYELEALTNYLFPLFIVKVQSNHEVDELFIGGDEFEEPSNTSEKKKRFFKISKDKLMKELSRNKFSLLLVFISTLLMQVTIPLGILSVYLKNGIYVFLFICGLLGIALNIHCYVDYFNNRNIKNPLFVISASTNLIGIAVGIGLFAIFYNIPKKTEGVPNVGSFILIGTLVTLIVIAATISIVYFIPRKNKLK